MRTRHILQLARLDRRCAHMRVKVGKAFFNPFKRAVR